MLFFQPRNYNHFAKAVLREAIHCEQHHKHSQPGRGERSKLRRKAFEVPFSRHACFAFISKKICAFQVFWKPPGDEVATSDLESTVGGAGRPKKPNHHP